VVGGYEIGGPSLWRDEAYTRDAITRPVGKIFALLAHTDAVHGAYYLLMHFVVGVIGTSATALRFPSLCAMVVAAAFTAAIGRRAATLAQTPDAAGRGRALIPALTGLLSGLVFATAPFMTYYAQMARSYAIVTMFATIASYLLLRAYPGGGWRWWSAYGAAVALTGLFNVFGLLILVAHGVTLLLTATTGPARPGRRIGRLPVGWLAASAAAVIVLIPFLSITYSQRGQISWLTRPDFETLASLGRDFAGSNGLIVVFGLLALGGIAACCLADDWRPLNPAAIALPWLVVPPFLLIVVSFVDPVYDQRYVEFCLPAFAICVASGIGWLWRLAGIALGRTRLGRAWLGRTGPGRTWPGPGLLSWLALLPALAAAVALVVALLPADAVVRLPGYQPDNLEREAGIIAANARPGDIAFFIPVNDRIVSMPFPSSWRKLRDIALETSPVASDTLYGTDVGPATLLRRFTHVTRVWVISSANDPEAAYLATTEPTALDREEYRLVDAMRRIHRWRDGDTELTLYAAR
jgi:mannosyltransferase